MIDRSVWPAGCASSIKKRRNDRIARTMPLPWLRGAMCASLLGASGLVFAETPTLSVSVRVSPTRAAPEGLSALPLPPEAIRLTSNAFGGSFRYPGKTSTAVSFFEAQLPRNGYRLVSASNARMVWESDRARLTLELSELLGHPEHSRILVILTELTRARAPKGVAL